jgi:alkylation response protein AidB-like acyl-CoA dehydrogenase
MQAGDYASAIRAITEVSHVCGASGFMAWCQQVCGLYRQQRRNPALTGLVLAAHASGVRLGGTGMCNPMMTCAGTETMLLRPTPVGGGYRLNGTLAWISQLGPDQCAGVLAAVDVAAGEPPCGIMFLLRCHAEGVELRPCPSFSAREGTNTLLHSLQQEVHWR